MSPRRVENAQFQGKGFSCLFCSRRETAISPLFRWQVTIEVRFCGVCSTMCLEERGFGFLWASWLCT